jgi:adenylate kinase
MIIFMGVTGAGKSIQGQLLADKLHIPWMSTGEILRSQLAGKPDERMMSGKLFGDEEIIQLVDTALNELPNHDCVLDGFPRTHAQAEWLVGQVKAGRINLEAVIHLKVSAAIMSARLQSRGRPDDTTEAIRQRFTDYHAHTLPLVAELRDAGITVLEIDGEKTIEEVSQTIVKTLGI